MAPGATLVPSARLIAAEKNCPTGENGNFYTFTTISLRKPFNLTKNLFPDPFSKGKPLIELGQLFLLHNHEKIAETNKCVFFLQFIGKGLLSVKGVLRMQPWCYKL